MSRPMRSREPASLQTRLSPRKRPHSRSGCRQRGRQLCAGQNTNAIVRAVELRRSSGPKPGRRPPGANPKQLWGTTAPRANRKPGAEHTGAALTTGSAFNPGLPAGRTESLLGTVGRAGSRERRTRCGTASRRLASAAAHLAGGHRVASRWVVRTQCRRLVLGWSVHESRVGSRECLLGSLGSEPAKAPRRARRSSRWERRLRFSGEPQPHCLCARLSPRVDVELAQDR